MTNLWWSADFSPSATTLIWRDSVGVASQLANVNQCSPWSCTWDWFPEWSRALTVKLSHFFNTSWQLLRLLIAREIPHDTNWCYPIGSQALLETKCPISYTEINKTFIFTFSLFHLYWSSSTPVTVTCVPVHLWKRTLAPHFNLHPIFLNRIYFLQLQQITVPTGIINLSSCFSLYPDTHRDT